MQYCVYIIGKQEDLLHPYTNCYIGVTNKLQTRWKYHMKSPYTVGEFIRKYSLTYDDNMIIIHSGTDVECFDVERILRPVPFMGLNEAAGGHGGHTSYTLERNAKISAKMKGRTVTWAHKVSETKRKNGTAVGANNNKAKMWIVQDPHGNIFEINGNLKQFCEYNRILSSCLSYYRGQVVPDPNTSTRGGFRMKNETSQTLRYNTTGWKLSEYVS